MLLRVGGKALAEKMKSLFETTAPAKVTKIKESVADGNSDSLAQAAHSLKASAGQMGALELMETAGEIEIAAECGDMELAAVKTMMLDVQLAAAVAWITETLSPTNRSQ